MNQPKQPPQPTPLTTMPTEVSSDISADAAKALLLFEKLRETLPASMGGVSKDGHENIVVPTPALIQTLKWLRDEMGYSRFIDVTCVDMLDNEAMLPEGIDSTLRYEVHVMLYSMDEHRWVRVMCYTDGDCPSITPLFWGAHNSEREVYDLFGVNFVGHPSLTRIMMPDAWKGHPLRKDDGLVNEPVDFTVTRPTFMT